MIWQFVCVGAIIGLIIPVVYDARYIYGGHMFGSETVLLWPSSIILMAADGREHSAFAYLTLAISILENVVLYAIMGLLLFGIFKVTNKPIKKMRLLPDVDGFEHSNDAHMRIATAVFINVVLYAIIGIVLLVFSKILTNNGMTLMIVNDALIFTVVGLLVAGCFFGCYKIVKMIIKK